jgi:hypothetical protein
VEINTAISYQHSAVSEDINTAISHKRSAVSDKRNKIAFSYQRLMKTKTKAARILWLKADS